MQAQVFGELFYNFHSLAHMTARINKCRYSLAISLHVWIFKVRIHLSSNDRVLSITELPYGKAERIFHSRFFLVFEILMWETKVINCSCVRDFGGGGASKCWKRNLKACWFEKKLEQSCTIKSEFFMKHRSDINKEQTPYVYFFVLKYFISDEIENHWGSPRGNFYRTRNSIRYRLRGKCDTGLPNELPWRKKRHSLTERSKHESLLERPLSPLTKRANATWRIFHIIFLMYHQSLLFFTSLSCDVPQQYSSSCLCSC